jgi:hypothetical protein
MKLNIYQLNLYDLKFHSYLRSLLSYSMVFYCQVDSNNEKLDDFQVLLIKFLHQVRQLSEQCCY